MLRRARYNLVMRMVFLLFAAIGIAAGQPSVSDLFETKALGRIRAIDDKLNGVLGVAAIDLNTGRSFAYNGESQFPQASSIKIPILIELFRAANAGNIQLDAKVTLRKADAVGGSGHLKSFLRDGSLTISTLDLATAMIESSDNTATNKLISMLGAERINRTLTELGLQKTKLQRVMLDTAAAAAGHENLSTPLEMARLAELIYRGKAVDAESSRKMIDILKLVDADMRESIPSSVPVAAKPGSVPAVRCETGIVFLQGRPFVLSVMSTFLDQGVNPVPAVTKVIFEHFQKLAVSNGFGSRLR